MPTPSKGIRGQWRKARGSGFTQYCFWINGWRRAMITDNDASTRGLEVTIFTALLGTPVVIRPMGDQQVRDLRSAKALVLRRVRKDK